MPTGATIEARLTLNARQFTNAVEKARNQVINLAEEALKASKKQSIAINNLVTAYSGVSTTIRRVKNTQDAMRATLNKDIEALKKYGATSKEVDKLSKAFSINELDIKDLTNQMKRLTAAGNADIESAKRLQQEYLELAQEFSKVSARASKVKSNLAALMDKQKAAAIANKDLTATQKARIGALNQEQAELNQTKGILKAEKDARKQEEAITRQSAQAHLKSAKAMGAEIGVIQQSQNAILKRTGALVKEKQAEEREREKLKQTEAALKANTTARRSNLAAIRAHLSAIQKSTHSFGTFSKAIGTSITLWYTFRTAIYAVKRAFEAVLSVYREGVEVTDDFRLAVISSSAIMAGAIVQGTTAAEKMALALEYNVDLYKKLELVAARHISTGKAVRDVYEGLIIARIYPGKEDVENIAKLADFITLYTKGQRLEIQLMQEVRGLMDGQVRAQNKLAYTLDRILNGKLKEHIRLWKNAGTDASGQLVILKEITRLLGDIGSLQGEILGTAQTWENTLRTIAERLLRDSIIGYYRDYRDLVQAISEYLFDLTEEYYTQEGLLVKGIIEQGWERLKDIARGFIGSELTDIKEIVNKLLKDMSEWIRKDAQSFINFGKSLRATFNGILFLVRNIKVILQTILVLAIPTWGMKILRVILAVFSGASGTAAALLGWIPLLGLILYHVLEIAKESTFLSSTFEDVDLATASLGEAMELGANNAEDLADAVKEIPDPLAEAKKQSEDFLYLLAQMRQKQVSINDTYANFTDEVRVSESYIAELVRRSVEDAKERAGAVASENVVLHEQKRIREFLIEEDEKYRKSALESIKEEHGILASENILLREQARLRERLAGETPSFARTVSEDPELQAKVLAAQQKTEKLRSEIEESRLKILSDANKAELEAQGKRVKAARIAMAWELKAFEENQRQKIVAFETWAATNIKDERVRAVVITDFRKTIEEKLGMERLAFERKLLAEIERLEVREAEKAAKAKQRVLDRYNKWRERDVIDAEGRLNKLREDLALRSQGEVVDKITQARITLSARLVAIETTSQKRIADAVALISANYESVDAAQVDIAAEKQRILSQTNEEKFLTTAITNEYIKQIQLLRQMKAEQTMVSSEQAHAKKMATLDAQFRQIQYGQTPFGPRMAQIDEYNAKLDEISDRYANLITGEIDLATRHEKTWTAANEQISAYNTQMTQELGALHRNFQAQMGKTQLQEAQAWAAVAEMGVGNIAEMFRLMAQHNKKYFKWYQVFATGQILISAAMAIMKVWEVWAAVPMVAAALTATIGALSAAQIGVVWAQEPPQEMAAGGVRESGFGGLYGAYNRPTYMIAEAGAPEAVVPLDKYDISKKGTMGKTEVHHHYHINALDPAAWADFARRNPGPFREQFTTAIEENDPAVRGAVQAAAR